MKKLSLMIAGLLVSAALTLAAGIDGKWSMEGAANAKGKTQTLTLNLKADGDKLAGNIEGMGRKGAGVTVQDGKVDGNKFSFATTVTTKKGDQKVIWEGTVEGDAIKGTRMREGGKKGQPFTAKRAS
jgi:hypothetical protein